MPSEVHIEEINYVLVDEKVNEEEPEVNFEETIDDEEVNEEESSTAQEPQTKNENVVSDIGNTARFGDQIANIDNNSGFIESVLGKESAGDVLNAMNSLLETAKPCSSMEAVIKSQGELFESTEIETWVSILQNTPKEVFWIGLPCLTLLVWKSGEILLYLLAAGLICFIVAKVLAHFETAQKSQMIVANRKLQIQAVAGEDKLGKETAKALADKAKEIQSIRTNAVVKVTKIYKATVDSRLTALKEMHNAEIKGRKTIAKLEQDGATGREEMIQKTKAQIAEVKAVADKFKAEILKQSKLELKTLEKEQTKLKEDSAREIKKIETNMAIEIEKLQSAAKERKIQFETDQAAMQRAQELKLAEEKLRSDAEKHSREVAMKRETELRRIEAEMMATTERTRQIEIEERNKTEREKDNCSIQ